MAHPCPRARSCARRGITLVEVLATLVLIGIVVPAAMQGLDLCLRAASLARHQQEASFLAESWLNELHVTRDPTQLNTSGTFGEAWPDYRWEAVQTTRDFSLIEIEIRVIWQERGTDRGLVMSTLIYPLDTPLGTGSTGTAAGGL